MKKTTSTKTTSAKTAPKTVRCANEAEARAAAELLRMIFAPEVEQQREAVKQREAETARPVEQPRMSVEEAVKIREQLLAEQRKTVQAIKILRSESMLPCAEINAVIAAYSKHLTNIDERIRALAEACKPRVHHVQIPTVGQRLSRNEYQTFIENLIRDFNESDFGTVEFSNKI